MVHKTTPEKIARLVEEFHSWDPMMLPEATIEDLAKRRTASSSTRLRKPRRPAKCLTS